MSTPARISHHHVWNAKKTAIILTPGFALVATAFRLLIISNYQTTTAVAVAASSGVISTLVGTLVPIVQVFLPEAVVILLGVVIFYRGDDGAQVRRRYDLLAVLAIGGILVVTPTKVSWKDIVSEVFSSRSTYLLGPS